MIGVFKCELAGGLQIVVHHFAKMNRKIAHVVMKRTEINPASIFFGKPSVRRSVEHVVPVQIPFRVTEPAFLFVLKDGFSHFSTPFRSGRPVSGSEASENL